MSGIETRPAALTAYTRTMNFVPLIYVIAGIAIVWNIDVTTQKVAAGLAWIYLVPALVCRLVLAIAGRPHGRGLTQETRDYRIWWFLTQLQVLHNRLPWLEEFLRLAPGLYAAWIRLWGGRVSPMVYWGPQSTVTDRYLLNVEAGSVIGMQAALAGHMGTVGEDGVFRVDVAAPHVEAGAIVGARAGLGPGATLSRNAMLPPGRKVAPFGRWPRVKEPPAGMSSTGRAA